MARPRLLITLVALGVLATVSVSCRRKTEPGSPADTLTQRQKDSIAGSLPVPGAGAIQKALEASDAARARAEQHDSVLR
jgi:hypothetical protein